MNRFFLALIVLVSLGLSGCEVSNLGTGSFSDGTEEHSEAPTDAVVDQDNDSVPDTDDAFPNDPNEWSDFDGDGIGDNADTDDDNDGVADIDDAFPFDDSKNEAEVPPSVAGAAFYIRDTSTTSVSLGWRLPETVRADGVKLFRNNELIVTLGTDLSSYLDGGLQRDTTYQYALKFYNQYGDSDALSLTASTLLNDAPKFLNLPGTITVDDNAPVDSVVLQINASDAENDAITYLIADGNADGYFSLDAQSGALTVAKNLLPMAGKVFALTVEIRDGFNAETQTFKVGVFAATATMPAETGLLIEYYDVVTNGNVDTLIASDLFPDQPDRSQLIASADAPKDVGNTYGARMSGYLIPPVTGDYTFWVAADDDGHLLLSSDRDPGNLQLIADTNGYTPYQNWTQRASQKSSPIALIAGQPYYFEALLAEHSGGDQLSVAWQGPGIEQSVITDKYLRPVVDFDDPQSPDTVRVSKTTENSVLLEWNEGADNRGVQLYRIYDNNQLLASTTELSLTLLGLNSNRVYGLHVEAVDFAGNQSHDGKVVYVRIDDYLAPSVPENLTATQVSIQQVTLNWNASTDENNTAVVYTLFQDDVAVAQTFDTQLTLKNLTPDTAYRFQLAANDQVGNQSALSASLTVNTPALNPATPEFGRPFYGFTVDPNDVIGAAIGSVIATDPNGKILSYSIISGNESGYFSIDATGKLAIAADLTTVEATSSEVVVRADNGEFHRDISVEVMILSDAQLSRQGVERQLWQNQSGKTVADINVATTVTIQDTLPTFETPSDIGENYSQRVRALLRPKVSGTYRFWIASDDYSQLALSSDALPVNAQPIAEVVSWVPSHSWRDSNQLVASVELEAGQFYYIEALHKEGGGGDHLSVAWQGGDVVTQAIISSDYLIPYSALRPSLPAIARVEQSDFETGGHSLTVTVVVTEDSVGQPFTVLYGFSDGGDNPSTWQSSFDVAGFDAPGTYTVVIPDIDRGQTYYLALYADGTLMASWSGVNSIETIVIDDSKPFEEALPQTLSLTLDVNGVAMPLALEKYSVRSPNFELWTFDDRRMDQFEQVLPLPEVRTYQGTVTNDPSLLVTAVVDLNNKMYLSLWNGSYRYKTLSADISEWVNSDALGVAETRNDEILLGIEVPDSSEENRLFTPQPGADFFNNLARINYRYKEERFYREPQGNLVNALAVAEITTLNLNFVWAQKTGLRWDTNGLMIEVHGNTDDRTQPAPVWTDAHNFRADIQTSSGAFCWGGGSWVGCVGSYSTHGAWYHEVGHNMGLGHGEPVDVSNNVQDMGTQLSAMQSRRTLQRMQYGSQYKPAKAITMPMLPAAYKDYLTTYENETGTVEPLANDYDVNGDTLTIHSFDTVTEHGGSVTRQGDVLRYTPPQGYVGTDRFAYVVSDGQLQTTGPVEIQVVPNGLAGHWTMETVSVDGVSDDSGYDHLLLPRDTKEAATNYVVPGVTGSAMNHVLVAEEKRVKDAIGQTLQEHVLDPGYKNYTASLWFKYSNIGGKKSVIEKAHTSAVSVGYGGWEISFDENDIVIDVVARDRFAQKNGVQIRLDDAITDGQWHHLAMVIDQGNRKVIGYFDGSPFPVVGDIPLVNGPIMDARGWGGYSYGTPLVIGAFAMDCSSDSGCTPNPDSAFDNVRIYHKALTANEVLGLYSNKQ